MEAASSFEALEVVKRWSVEVVLLDMMLPGILVTILMSAVVEHICDLSKRLRKEVGEPKLSEEALWERSRRLVFCLWSERARVTDT